MMNFPTERIHMENMPLNHRVIDDLIHTVRVGESGRELENPDREFILRYYLIHQDDPSIQAMIEEYYNQAD